jgi:hypothetical protein
MLVAVVGVVGALQLTYWFDSSSATGRPLDSYCRSLDQLASDDVARLLHDASPAGEATFDYALFQLRRARQHCRSGWIKLAQREYEEVRLKIPPQSIRLEQR